MALSSTLEFCRLNNDPQSNSQLLSLPAELLQAIGSRLDAVDTICLTLTCKKATMTIGFMSWASVSVVRPNVHKRRLLRALSRDLPEYHYCHYQDQLCKTPGAEVRNSDSNSDRRCPASGLRADERFSEMVPRLPSYCDVELIMARHIKGPPWGIPVESAAASTAWRPRNSILLRHNNRHSCFTKVELTCAIVHDRLYSRYIIRNWLSVEAFTQVLRRALPSMVQDAFVMQPCPHIPLETLRNMLKHTALGVAAGMQCSQAWLPTYATVVETCLRCKTQHRMQAFNHNQYGIEIVQVFWNYLGDGGNDGFDLYNTLIRQSPGWPRYTLRQKAGPSPQYFCAWEGADKIESAADPASLSMVWEAWKSTNGSRENASKRADRPQTKEPAVTEMFGAPVRSTDMTSVGPTARDSLRTIDEVIELRTIQSPSIRAQLRSSRLRRLLWWRRDSKSTR